MVGDGSFLAEALLLLFLSPFFLLLYFRIEDGELSAEELTLADADFNGR